MKHLLYWLLVLTTTAIVAQKQENNVQIRMQLASAELVAGEKSTIEIEFQLAPGWHLYAPGNPDTVIATQVTPVADSNFAFDTPIYPQGIKKELLGMEFLLYEKNVTISVPFQLLQHGKHSLQCQVLYQACTDQLCLRPETQDFSVDVIVAPGKKVVVSPQTATNTETETTDEVAQENLLTHGLWWAFVVAFIGGIFTSLTPCVYPMIPVTISFFASQSKDKTRVQILILSLVFVLGIATLYTTVGIVTGLLKQSFSILLQNRVVIAVFVAIFFLLGLSMFGAFAIRLPAFITNRTQVSRGGTLGAFARGLFLGIVAVPCMGPVSAAILPLVPANPLLGGLLLFVYACGVGVLFVILALLPGILPRGGSWLYGFEIILGNLVIIVALIGLEILVSLKFLAVVIGVLATGESIFFLRQMLQNQRANVARVVGFILTTLVALTFLAGFAVKVEQKPLPEYLLSKALFYGEWHGYHEGIELAQKEKKPAIVDVWAKWCTPCRIMDVKVFPNAKVVEALQRFVKIKADITSDSQLSNLLRKKYGIQGAPSFVFYDSQGQWLPEKTIHGKTDVESLLAVLKSIR